MWSEVAEAAHRLAGVPAGAGEVIHVVEGDGGGDAHLQAGGGVVEKPLKARDVLELVELRAARVDVEGKSARREINAAEDDVADVGEWLAGGYGDGGNGGGMERDVCAGGSFGQKLPDGSDKGGRGILKGKSQRNVWRGMGGGWSHMADDTGWVWAARREENFGATRG